MKSRLKEILKGSNLAYIALVFIAILAIVFLFRKVSISNNFSKNTNNSSNPQATCAVYFQPDSLSVVKNSQFTVDVMVDPANHKVSNLDLSLTYDTTKLQLESISQSKDFTQVLTSNITQGNAMYSAGTTFGSSISSPTVYATLHFRALEKTGQVGVQIDSKKSGVYSDDNPGVNELGKTQTLSVSISDK